MDLEARRWHEEMDFKDSQHNEERAMPSYVSAPENTGADFPVCPTGTHIAICDRVINIGQHKNEYEGNITHKNQHYIRFQIPAERVSWEDEQGRHEGPITVAKWYTSSLHEKATLRKDLESWRGRAFTTEELVDWDLFSVLGIPCQISVGRTTGGKAKILSVMGLPKGMPKPALDGEAIGYDSFLSPGTWDKLPAGIQRMCAEGHATPEDAAAENATASNGGSHPVTLDDGTPFNDDIPFGEEQIMPPSDEPPF
jgi:hypothetical protein